MNDTVVRMWLNFQSSINCMRSGRQPLRKMPSELSDRFTLGQQIPTMQWYLNDIRVGGLRWTTKSRWWSQAKVEKKTEGYYKQTDTFFYQSLADFPLQGKEAVILGSEMPWYECISHFYGAKVTTIEYRTVDCQIPGLTVMTPTEFAKAPRQFDAAVSISSIEHDGLGRYGDPIDPDGDLKAMNAIRDLLHPEGVLYLSVPVGSDVVVWNAHRIYGPRRLPMLLNGWQVLNTYGMPKNSFERALGDYRVQPVFVLKPSVDTFSA